LHYLNSPIIAGITPTTIIKANTSATILVAVSLFIKSPALFY